MSHLHARLGILLPVLAIAACDAQRSSVPTAPADPAAAVANAAGSALSCTRDGSGPYTLQYEWSGLSVYQVTFFGGAQDVTATLKHPTRRVSNSITLSSPVVGMTLWSKRGTFLAQTFCAITS